MRRLCGKPQHDIHSVLYVLERCRRRERPVSGGAYQPMERFAAFEGKSDIRTWIYRVSLNTCISVDRKKKRHKTVPLSMSINLFEDNDADTRQVQLLYKRINRLGPFDKALVLLWLENLSYDEIGAVMGISAKNVSVKLVRIRELLKKCQTIKERILLWRIL